MARVLTKCKIDQLKEYPNNPRSHSEAQVAKLADSIAGLGWGRPIVIDEDRQVLGGHGCLLAAQRLMEEGRTIRGWPDPTQVPVRQMLDLNDDEKRAYIIADNRLGEDSTWDENRLIRELQGFEDHELRALTGFDENDIARMLGVPDEGSGGAAGQVSVVQHVVTVECADEAEQEALFQELTGRGMTCKVQSL